MSEMVIDGESGILVASERNGEARSGIPAWDPDVGELAAAIERLGDRAELARMRNGVERLREQRAWRHTVEGLGELLG
jgi:glycosyltransferase involved in cell wall biosynthesis